MKKNDFVRAARWKHCTKEHAPRKQVFILFELVMDDIVRRQFFAFFKSCDRYMYTLKLFFSGNIKSKTCTPPREYLKHLHLAKENVPRNNYLHYFGPRKHAYNSLTAVLAYEIIQLGMAVAAGAGRDEANLVGTRVHKVEK